ncbi:MAG: permease-like cell division protein FtsX [Betaproteobacteria bacterium]|nr:permease-like cell division protein FtsX [Betaproteobacteria bacterium]MDH5221803.1 permease-like cell division protein FtsX [Betaproteobacteria bacterium]MDH5349217.1 permease-like cell division protein FtsX [Betaproteobacteria bacterium]
MRTWLRQHREALARALGRLGAQRMATLLNALVIGVALSLPAGGYLLLSGLQGVAQRVSYEPQVSVFLKAGAAQADLEARMRRDPRVAGLRFVSRDEALAELRVTEELADVVAQLERNPLPDAFVVRSADAAPAALEALAEALRALPGVARVQVDSAWAQRLAALVRTGRLALGALAVLLATGLVAVTFNTIRLQILTQREEIEVSRLLGASDGFVRRPLLYLGFLQGLAGGALGLAILAGALAVLNVGVRELAQTYGSSFSLPFLPWDDALSVVGFSGFLGWLGSAMSVSRHLR